MKIKKQTEAFLCLHPDPLYKGLFDFLTGDSKTAIGSQK